MRDQDAPIMMFQWIVLLRVLGNIFHGKQGLRVYGMDMGTRRQDVPVVSWYGYCDDDDNDIPEYVPDGFQFTVTAGGGTYDAYYE